MVAATEAKPNTELKMLRRREVEAITRLSRSSIYNGVNAGTFPRPVRLTQMSVAWLESEINDWLRERIAASRNVSA